ncbi:MAG: glycerol-3-phosphate ABC transporter ATP-binding protein, partial [Clostridiales bacterium]|nr:glycerol-3-phosphate ABC transporter ATP-binding protein [Clostridiales bacterium]MDD6390125.1 glycerol-3-phosphate ABC transporter ATP-binding protein [Bacillota bacterium]
EEAMKDAHPESVMKVDVTLAEMMGSEIYVYTEYAGTKVISRVPAKYDIKTDDKVTLVPDVNKIHIFDPETEEVICQ